MAIQEIYLLINIEMRYLKILSYSVISRSVITSCDHQINSPLDEQRYCMRTRTQLTNVIIYDVFTPPVASRIYGYTSAGQL